MSNVDIIFESIENVHMKKQPLLTLFPVSLFSSLVNKYDLKYKCLAEERVSATITAQTVD